MKKVISLFLKSGLWLQPIIMLGVKNFLNQTRPSLNWDSNTWLSCGMVSIIPILFYWLEELSRPREQEAYTGKNKAMYPSVDKELIRSKPTGIILGKEKSTNKYVCKDINEDGHVILIGGSGSGKSACYVIPSILANPLARIFAIDIKGELNFKTKKYTDEKVLVFNPEDRTKYGYDPLFNLNSESNVQEILAVMQNIAYSLIAMPAGLKDPFWKNSARNLLIGLLIYYYRQGVTDFVGIIDEILGKPIKESIQEVMTKANHGSVEYRYIVQFSNMEDATLGGIISEMNNHIVIFANDQNIRYAFNDNGKKLNPHMLEEGYSIFISIKEEKLAVYYDVLQLIINQTLAELEKRPENSDPIIMCIDELPRILSAGKIDRLLDAARTLRSRKVCLYLVTQSTEALMSAFTENEVTDLISNCSYIIVLQASSPKTQKMICAWCGKYKAKKKSWNGTGKGTKTSITYEEKDIVEPSDLMELKRKGEAILVTPYGYCRVKKTPWYKDKYLKPVAEEAIEFNKTINELKEY